MPIRPECLPSWCLWAIAIAVTISGVAWLIVGCLVISAAALKRILLLLKLHHCFIDFMGQWLRKRAEVKGESDADPS